MGEVGRRFWGISYRKINSSAAGNITQDLRVVGAKLKHLRSGRKSQKFDYRNHKTCKMIAAWIPGLQLTQDTRSAVTHPVTAGSNILHPCMAEVILHIA